MAKALVDLTNVSANVIVSRIVSDDIADEGGEGGSPDEHPA